MASGPLTKEKALERLASLCSRSEQCESDLTKKLLNWDINAGERKEIIEYLKENRYLDDARYAKSFANDKARFSSWGPYKIRFELTKKHINSSLIKEALSRVELSVWKEGLLRNAEAKARTLDLCGEKGYEDRQKLFRYLIGKGFPSDSASKAVSLMRKRREETE